MNKFWTIYLIGAILTYIVNDIISRRNSRPHWTPTTVQIAIIFLAIFWFVEWIIIVGGMIDDWRKSWKRLS